MLDLINSLSNRSEDFTQPDPFSTELLAASPNIIPITDRLNTKPGLGNFDKLWRYLGQPLDAPSPRSESLFEVSSFTGLSEGLDASQTGVKGVKWRDKVKGSDLTEPDKPDSGTTIASLSNSLEEKEQRGLFKGESPQKRFSTKALSNDSEIGSEAYKRDVKNSSDRKAIIQRLLYGSPQKVERHGTVASSLIGKPQANSDHESSSLHRPRPLRGSLSAVFSSEQAEYATAAEKKATLIDKLRSKFVHERRFLGSIGTPPQVNNNDTSTEIGIHVFVDASNVGNQLRNIRVQIY